MRLIGIWIVVVVVPLLPLRGYDSPTGSVESLFPNVASIVIGHVAVGVPVAYNSVCGLVGLAGVAFSLVEAGVVFLQPAECVVRVVGALAVVEVAAIIELAVVFAFAVAVVEGTC